MSIEKDLNTAGGGHFQKQDLRNPRRKSNKMDFLRLIDPPSMYRPFIRAQIFLVPYQILLIIDPRGEDVAIPPMRLIYDRITVFIIRYAWYEIGIFQKFSPIVIIH